MKIQLLVLSIGLYAVLKDNKKLTKLMTSGLKMCAFVFINLMLMLSVLLLRDFQESITPIVDSIFYTIFAIVIFELILYSMVSNMNTMIFIVNSGLIVLLSILFTKANNQNKGDKSNFNNPYLSKIYEKNKKNQSIN